MDNTKGSGEFIDKEFDRVRMQIDKRKNELTWIVNNYKDNDVIDLAIILMNLYNDFEYFNYGTSKSDNRYYIIALIEVEIDKKENKIKTIMKNAATRNINVEQKLSNTLWFPKWIEVLSEVKTETWIVKKTIEDYIDNNCPSNNSEQIKSLIFAWYKDIPEDDISHNWFKAVRKVLDDMITRFWALQFAKAFSIETMLFYRRKMSEMNILNDELRNKWYEDAVLDFTLWLEKAIVFFENKSAFTQADNMYFFWLIKEFHKLINWWKSELSQEKVPMFSEEIVKKIIDRIHMIESFSNDTNTID